MSDLNLSDFWKALHAGGIHRKQFIEEAKKLSSQTWGYFNPTDILSILTTYGKFLKDIKDNEPARYPETKRITWLAVEGKCLSFVRRQAHEFGKDLSLLIPCLNNLADPNINIDVTQTNIKQVQRNIPAKNYEIFKGTISALLSYAEEGIQHFNGVQLNNFAVAMIGMRFQLVYVAELPKESLMHKFFDQTAKAMVTPDLGLRPSFVIAIADMSDKMFIIPPYRFMEAAKEWHSQQPPSQELDSAMEKFAGLEALAFEAYGRRLIRKPAGPPIK